MPEVLFISGGWDGHQPKECTELFAGWLQDKGWGVHCSDTLDALLDEPLMQKLTIIVPVMTMSEITGDQSAAIRKAVLNGVGLAGWHGGMCDSFRNDTEYQFMTGGQWVVHPGNIVKYKVNVKQDSEAFMSGLKDFAMESEQYYMHTDPGNEVLATTTFTGEYGDTPWIAGTVMPVVWKRMYGKGRVFYSSLGHVRKDFDVPEAFEIMKRGILWAAKQTVECGYNSK